jgi:hypothetical protein
MSAPILVSRLAIYWPTYVEYNMCVCGGGGGETVYGILILLEGCC